MCLRRGRRWRRRWMAVRWRRGSKVLVDSTISRRHGRLRTGQMRRLCRTSADITQRLAVSQHIFAVAFELCSQRLTAQWERRCLRRWSQTSRIRSQVGATIEVEQGRRTASLAKGPCGQGRGEGGHLAGIRAARVGNPVTRSHFGQSEAWSCARRRPSRLHVRCRMR